MERLLHQKHSFLLLRVGMNILMNGKFNIQVNSVESSMARHLEPHCSLYSRKTSSVKMNILCFEF